MLNIPKLAEKLSRHIKKDRKLSGILSKAKGVSVYYGGHMGAILADTVLQTRNKYCTVVQPQAEERRKNYPECSTISGIRKMLTSPNGEEFLHFYGRKQADKPQMFRDLLQAAQAADMPIETAKDAKKWLSSPDVRRQLKSEIRNVGCKTADYFYQRCGGDILISDRHIRRYVENAVGEKMNYYRYYDCQKIATKAAEILGIKSGQLDYAIWQNGQNE